MREKVPNPFGKLSIQNLGRAARTLLFFILFYLYLWLEVDLRLIYNGVGAVANFPDFFWGWTFFSKFATYPGGLVEYLSAFLSQFFYYSWAGAIVVTLQAWLICACTDFFLKGVNAGRFRCVRFIPPILLIITYNKYTYYFAPATALLAALLFASIYLGVIKTSKLFIAAAFLILSLILYYVAGGAYLLFAVLCAIYELFFNRRWLITLWCLLSAAVIPYIEGVIILDASIVDAYTNLLPLSWKIIDAEDLKEIVVIICILYLLLPVVTLVLGSWRMFVKTSDTALGRLSLHKAESGKARKKIRRKTRHKPANLSPRVLSWYAAAPLRRWIIESSVLFGVAAAGIVFSCDSERKALFEVDYYAYNKMWPEVIQCAQHCPNNYFMVHAVNRALYHTSRLGYEMFSYHQNPDTLFLTTQELLEAYWKRVDIYLDLGCINLAEHELTESLGTNTQRPAILKRLALASMVKGDIDTAGVYLHALGTTLFHADWAGNYVDLLSSDPDLSSEKYIQHLRSLMVDRDGIWMFSDNEKILLCLLEENSKNKMAFEYLMAWYMLTRQLDKFVRNIRRLDDFDYPDIPRHYEEAVLLYTFAKKKQVDLNGRRIRLDSRRRFARFNHILSLHGSNAQAAFDSLADYWDSYFFYYLYGYSGIKR